MVSIIHPSRSRPEKSHATIKKWIDNADERVEVIISLDETDPDLTKYLQIYSDLEVNFVIGLNHNAVDAINRGAEESTGGILVVVSDDTDCFPHWDIELILATKGKIDFIMKCNDGNVQSWIITMPVMDRVYYQRFGYIYYPMYKHLFVDTELTAVADLLGKKIECDLIFKHLHYSVTKEFPDEVSLKADATWEHGENLFIERYKNNFGLINPPGKITSPEYLNWIATKL